MGSFTHLTTTYTTFKSLFQQYVIKIEGDKDLMVEDINKSCCFLKEKLRNSVYAAQFTANEIVLDEIVNEHLAIRITYRLERNVCAECWVNCCQLSYLLMKMLSSAPNWCVMSKFLHKLDDQFCRCSFIIKQNAVNMLQPQVIISPVLQSQTIIDGRRQFL